MVNNDVLGSYFQSSSTTRSSRLASETKSRLDQIGRPRTQGEIPDADDFLLDSCVRLSLYEMPHANHRNLRSRKEDP